MLLYLIAELIVTGVFVK